MRRRRVSFLGRRPCQKGAPNDGPFAVLQVIARRFQEAAPAQPASQDRPTEGTPGDEAPEDFGDRFASIRSRLLELDGAAARRMDDIPGGVDIYARGSRRPPKGMRP